MNTRPLILAVGFLLLVTSSALAQSTDPYFTDFSANYDAIYHESGATSSVGGHFDLASTIKRDEPFIGPVGEVGFNHFNGGTVVSGMGGLRIRANVNPHVLPFAQVIVGLYHCGVCGINDLAIQAGGGVDLGFTDHAFRVRAQVDIRHVFDQFGDFNDERFSLGIVLPLNR
jgi:hypothetical protein